MLMSEPINNPLDIEKVPAKKPRATRVQEIEPGVWLYSNGEKRRENGTIAELPDTLKTHAITHDTAHDMLRLREQKKHEVMARALNREVQPELIAEFGEYAWMAEGAINMQRMATSPEAGKAAVMAFESVMEHTGHGKRRPNEGNGGGSPDVDAVRAVLRDVADMARALSQVDHE